MTSRVTMVGWGKGGRPPHTACSPGATPSTSIVLYSASASPARPDRSSADMAALYARADGRRGCGISVDMLCQSASARSNRSSTIADVSACSYAHASRCRPARRIDSNRVSTSAHRPTRRHVSSAKREAEDA
eukprot:scaffold282930_cov30-Tisochrysis_lutea.AAC.2